MKIKLGKITLLFFISMLFAKTSYAQNFVHPGLPFTINDLERMKANRTVSPWSESWNMIVTSEQASLDYIMLGPAVDVKNKGNDGLYINDVNAALYHALQYYFTKNEAHAEKAISIIRPWAITHKTWSGTSAHLGAAWRGGTFAQACEILRYTYPGWTDELTAECEDYLLNVFWPLFRLPNPLRAANQGANNLMGAMYVAVFCNDQEKFDTCIDAFLNDPCGGISNTLANGQNGDTGRDQGHSMGMIGNLATAAEIAWAQGIDLYDVLDNRLLTIHEYWTKYNSGGDVPWIDFGTCYGYYTSIGADGRNSSTTDAIPVTELIYGAYAIRKGMSAPYVMAYRNGLAIDENTFLFRKDSTFMTKASFSYNPNSELQYSDVTSLMSSDIGTVGLSGSANLSNGTWTVKGSGSDLYGPRDSDSFQYAYIPMSGDGSFIAKIESMDISNSLGKAALVIKETLSSNSMMAEVNGRSLTGSEYSSRGFYGADGDGKQNFPLSTIPTWVKIERRGDHITGYVGPDGITWTPMQHTLFTMSDNYYIGLGVCSNNTSLRCTTAFSNVQVGTSNGNENTSGTFLQIEAESYSAMSGVTTEISTDVSGSEQLSSIDVGDWMEYVINVPYSGTYSMDYRVASASSNSDVTLSVAGNTLEQLIFNATGGDNVWTTVHSATPFYLSKGTQTIKVLANSSNWKLNWLSLSQECSDAPIIAYVESFDSLGKSLGKRQTSKITLLPGNKASLQPLALENGTWSWSGPNGFTSTGREITFSNVEKNTSGNYVVSYVNDCGQISTETFSINVTDLVSFEAEDYTGMSGVTVENTDDDNGISNITSIVSGDWLEYQIDVPYRGIYSVDYRVASEITSIDFDFNVNGSFVNQVSFDATGGAQIWSTKTQAGSVYLEEGLQTLKILASSDAWNINWIQLNLLETVDECLLPYNNDGFDIKNTTIEWTSDPVNISCEEEVDLLVTIETIGSLSQSDSIKIFYKLDGSEKIEVTEKIESGSKMFVSVQNIMGNSLELIIESQTSSSTSYYSISDVSIYNGPNQFDRIEAENYDGFYDTNPEVTKDTGGGYNMAGTHDNSYLMYSNINLTEVDGIDVRFASRTSGGVLEVRIGSVDGELLGTVDIAGTGNWQSWKTVSGSLFSKVGFYDLYLIFTTEESGYVGNLNWVELTTTGLSTIDINLADSIKIYPNPAHGFLNIGLKQGIEVQKVNIYTIQGQHVLSSDNIAIDISNLKTGIYFVQVETNQGKSTKRVVIE